MNTNNSEMATETRNKIKKFFRSSLFIGIILILSSALIEQLLLPSGTIKGSKALELSVKILISVLNSIGIALLVGYWADMVKKSEDYIRFINHELRKTIIEKDFIQSLNSEEKLKVCENLIRPNDSNINNYSNIRSYMKNQSRLFLDFFNVNYRSNYVIDVIVYKENGKYVAEYTFSYRVYKINNEYQPISVIFEKESTIISTSIINEKGHKLMDIIMDNYNKDDKNGNETYKFEIPRTYYSNDFLTIKRIIKENGHSHWLTLNWSNITPIDGIHYKVRCKDGIIKEYYIFNDPDGYTPVLSNDRNELTIDSSQWLDPYSGFSIIIADPSEDDDF